jgi:hypothetical protein
LHSCRRKKRGLLKSRSRAKVRQSRSYDNSGGVHDKCYMAIRYFIGVVCIFPRNFVL